MVRRKADETALAEISPAYPKGRISKSEELSRTELKSLYGQAFVNPVFPVVYIDLLSKLSIINPDLTNTVSNIVELSNSGHQLEIVCDDETLAEECMDYLSAQAAKLAKDNAGIDGFLNAMFGQMARTGALSIEWVPENDLSGIKEVVFVPTQTVRFRWDDQKQIYKPFQMLKTGIGINDDEIELNPLTYLYAPLETIDGSPYGLPPFIAALRNIGIQKNMIDNLEFLTRKMGIMGLLRILVKAPARKPNEGDTTYTERCRSYLATVATEVRDNYKDGIAVGFQGAHDFLHQSTTADARGAETIFELNEEQVASGLKTDPGMIGRSYHRTETFVGVIYDKMCSQFGGYQRVARRGLEFGYKIDASLAGFQVDDINVLFNKIKPLNEKLEQDAEKVRIENVGNKLAMGIIDLDMAAHELGYDAPVKQSPDEGNEDKSGEIPSSHRRFIAHWKDGRYQLIRNPPLGLRKTFVLPNTNGSPVVRQVVESKVTQDDDAAVEDTAKSDTSIATRFEEETSIPKQPQPALSILAFDPSILQSNMEVMRNTSKVDLKLAEQMYYSEMEVYFSGALRKALDEAGKEMVMLYQQFPAISALEWANRMFGRIAHVFHEAFEGKEPSTTIIDALASIYAYYFYWDRDVLGNAKVKPAKNTNLLMSENIGKNPYTPGRRPNKNPLLEPIHSNTDFRQKAGVSERAEVTSPVFSNLRMPDQRAVEWLAQSDHYYLGKFVDQDPKIQKGIKDFLVDQYLEKGHAIGKSPKEINTFKAAFGEKIATQEYGLRRIIDTTVNRTRNCAKVSYMEAVGVVMFEIINPSDNRTCETCESMVGRTFEVRKAFDRMQTVMSQDVMDLPVSSPFLTSAIPLENLQSMSDEDLQAMGFDAPPFHCNCRCRCIVADSEVIEGSPEPEVVEAEVAPPDEGSDLSAMVLNSNVEQRLATMQARIFAEMDNDPDIGEISKWLSTPANQIEFRAAWTKLAETGNRDDLAAYFARVCERFDSNAVAKLKELESLGQVFSPVERNWYLAQQFVMKFGRESLEISISKKTDLLIGLAKKAGRITANEAAGLRDLFYGIPSSWAGSTDSYRAVIFSDLLRARGAHSTLYGSHKFLDLDLDELRVWEAFVVKHKIDALGDAILNPISGVSKVLSQLTDEYIASQRAITQKLFGEGKIVVRRGVHFDVENAQKLGLFGRKVGDEVTWHENPLSSWSASHEIADEFADTKKTARVGMVFRQEVDLNDVMFNPLSLGNLDEFELTLIGRSTGSRCVIEKIYGKLPKAPKVPVAPPPPVGKAAKLPITSSLRKDVNSRSVGIRKHWEENPLDYKKAPELLRALESSEARAAVRENINEPWKMYEELYRVLEKKGIVPHTGLADEEERFFKYWQIAVGDCKKDEMAFRIIQHLPKLTREQTDELARFFIGMPDEWQSTTFNPRANWSITRWMKEQNPEVSDFIMGRRKFLDKDPVALTSFLADVTEETESFLSKYRKWGLTDTMLDDLYKQYLAVEKVTKDALFGGQKTITVYRGIALDEATYRQAVVGGTKIGDAVTLHENPISSYSLSKGKAEWFADKAVYERRGQIGVVVKREVNVDDIFYSPLSFRDVKTMQEYEISCIGRKGGVKAEITRLTGKLPEAKVPPPALKPLPMPREIPKVPAKPKIAVKLEAPPKVGKVPPVKGIAVKEIDGEKNFAAVRNTYPEKLAKQMQVFGDTSVRKETVKALEMGDSDAFVKNLFSVAKKNRLTDAYDTTEWLKEIEKDIRSSLLKSVDTTLREMPEFGRLNDFQQRVVLLFGRNAVETSSQLMYSETYEQLSYHQFFQKRGAADFIFGNGKFLDFDADKRAAFQLHLKKLAENRSKEIIKESGLQIDTVMDYVNRARFSVNRAIARDLYGDETITLYRGVAYDADVYAKIHPLGLQKNAAVTAQFNPLSICSASGDVSRGFAEKIGKDQIGVVYQIKVKVKDIAFDPISGRNTPQMEFALISPKEGLKAKVVSLHGKLPEAKVPPIAPRPLEAPKTALVEELKKEKAKLEAKIVKNVGKKADEIDDFATKGMIGVKADTLAKMGKAVENLAEVQKNKDLMVAFQAKSADVLKAVDKDKFLAKKAWTPEWYDDVKKGAEQYLTKEQTEALRKDLLSKLTDNALKVGTKEMQVVSNALDQLTVKDMAILRRQSPTMVFRGAKGVAGYLPRANTVVFSKFEDMESPGTFVHEFGHVLESLRLKDVGLPSNCGVAEMITSYREGRAWRTIDNIFAPGVKVTDEQKRVFELYQGVAKEYVRLTEGGKVVKRSGYLCETGLWEESYMGRIYEAGEQVGGYRTYGAEFMSVLMEYWTGKGSTRSMHLSYLQQKMPGVYKLLVELMT